jgi:hypothetical protein
MVGGTYFQSTRYLDPFSLRMALASKRGPPSGSSTNWVSMTPSSSSESSSLETRGEGREGDKGQLDELVLCTLAAVS